VLCLRCHVNPDVETGHPSERFSDRFSRTDGVGCESCHGAAEKWLSVHYTAPWKGISVEEKQREKRKLGMVDTKDLQQRAQVCIRCHVGEQEADVNHDLIAAGHPRLRFEYGAYLSNYPARHWKVDDERRRYPDFEARAWLLGQVLSAKAALDLLAYRAEPKHDKPWPELGEYGCFGCHHDLRDQPWRQKRGAGQLPWGTWYFAMRSVVADEIPHVRPTDFEAFRKFEKLMAKQFPNRAEVTREAANVSQILDGWASGIGRECRNEKSLMQLLSVLVKEGAKPEPEWDRAAQHYLGIAAVYNALSDLDERFQNDTQLKSAVYHLADKLGQAFKDPGVKYDSPRKYNPDALQNDLRHLGDELRRRNIP
jgi:hypothetical protein